MSHKTLATVSAMTMASFILGLIAWVVTADQVLAEDRGDRKTITFGSVELHLGMTLDEVQQALAKDFSVNGAMSTPDSDPSLNSWDIRPKDSSGPQIGGFTLQKGRLIYSWQTIKRYSDETVPAGQVISDVVKALQKLSNKECDATQCVWESGGVLKDGRGANTTFAWNAADGKLKLTYYDSPHGSRTTSISYVIGSYE